MTGSGTTGLRASARLEPASFDELDGWMDDDHAAALGCFLKSAAVLGASHPELGDLIASARRLFDAGAPREAARLMFEQHFVPHRVVHEFSGFVTGYFEPILAGHRSRTGRFNIPLYRRPPELVTLVDDALRGSSGGALTHACRTTQGNVPFATRQAIEEGALAGRELELCWLADPVDVFFLQVQGSGVIELENEGPVRVGYDGKNGHPYTSIGKVLIEQGEISAAAMSLDTLRAWLGVDQGRTRATLWKNASYVFFREHSFRPNEGPTGVRDITLTPGRSLAVDASFNRIGLPIFVNVPNLAKGAGDYGEGLHRLMIAQDVGSAITGPERGDIFFGTGSEAGRMAGSTRHNAKFHVLLPRGVAVP